MEKQRAIRNFYKRIGLLIVLSLFCENVFSQNLYGRTSEFFLVAEYNNIFSDNEILFSTFLPDMTSSSLQIVTPDFGDDVNFLLLRSFDFFVRGKKGARIEVTLSFTRSGNFILPPVTIVDKGRRVEIPFESFYVQQNISSLVPSMVVRFENAQNGALLAEITDDATYSDEIFSIESGMTIYVKINLQNSSSMEKLSWNIPERSLFTHIEQNGAHSFFEWIPLAAGNVAAPIFNVSATSYEGNVFDMASPAIFVNVLQSSDVESGKNIYIPKGADNSFFPNAFESEQEAYAIEKSSGAQMSLAECEALAFSFAQETNRFRIALKIFIGMVVISVALFILGIAKKRKRILFVAIVLFIVFSAGIVFCAIKVVPRFGIFIGGYVSTIPENVSGQNITVAAGEKVQIMQSAGDWCYIKCDVARGWVLSDSLILIK